MKVRQYLALLAVVVMFRTDPAVAQQAASVPRLQAGIGVVAGGGVDDFGRHVPDGVGGVLGHLDSALGKSIFSLGGELSYLWYGEDERTVWLGALVPEIPDVSIKVNTTNAMLLLHARLRAQRRTGRWRPYADGLFGFTDLFTKSSISGPEVCSGGFYWSGTCVQTDYASSTNARDVVLSYGGGAGVMIRFTASPTAPRLDISGRYIRGGDAKYLTQGAIHVDEGKASFDFSRSRTDIVVFYVGVAIGR